MDYLEKNKRLRDELLDEAELERIENAHPDGFSSAEIISIFSERGGKFSEATFRKYVQLGLLPRSKRVGTKGKHKGSRGVYPPGTLRQLNEIKRLMALDYTIEEIRQQFAFVGGELEQLRSMLEEVLDRLEENLAGDDGQLQVSRVVLRRRVDEARQAAMRLLAELGDVAGSIREEARTAREAV